MVRTGTGRSVRRSRSTGVTALLCPGRAPVTPRVTGRTQDWPAGRRGRYPPDHRPRARDRPGREDPVPMAGMQHFTIATEAEKSADFRRVLWTGRHTQLV